MSTNTPRIAPPQATGAVSSDRAPNARVAMELDAERYWELVLAALERLGADG